MQHHSDPMLRLIAAFKLVKAAALSVDPHGTYLDRLIARVGSLDRHQLEEIGIGSLLYAAVFVTEGIGLLLRKIWAEILTVVVTTSIVPIEVYELVKHTSWVKACVLAANVAVVGYLVWRLRRQRVWPFRGITAEKTALP